MSLSVRELNIVINYMTEKKFYFEGQVREFLAVDNLQSAKESKKQSSFKESFFYFFY